MGEHLKNNYKSMNIPAQTSKRLAKDVVEIVRDNLHDYRDELGKDLIIVSIDQWSKSLSAYSVYMYEDGQWTDPMMVPLPVYRDMRCLDPSDPNVQPPTGFLVLKDEDNESFLAAISYQWSKRHSTSQDEMIVDSISKITFGEDLGPVN